LFFRVALNAGARKTALPFVVTANLEMPFSECRQRRRAAVPLDVRSVRNGSKRCALANARQFARISHFDDFPHHKKPHINQYIGFIPIILRDSITYYAHNDHFRVATCSSTAPGQPGIDRISQNCERIDSMGKEAVAAPASGRMKLPRKQSGEFEYVGQFQRDRSRPHHPNDAGRRRR
jgi:hypothetical protein